MATECAVCYVTDMDFMLPTLVSAVGLRRFVPSTSADIYIFAVDIGEARINEIENFVKAHEIHVVLMRTSLFADIDWARSAKTHVPLATLGRFFIDGLLPNTCERIVYLDGDTWIKRDPIALIELRVPDGKIAAVEDISFFCRRDLTAYGRFVKRYFQKIGNHTKRGYFNAGVFAVQRSTWRKIAIEALEFFKLNVESCKYHDQSALNAVVRDRRLRLSLAWNFQTPYRFWNVEKDVNPVIYHFTQGPKPWMALAEPWSDMFLPYQMEIASFSSLGLPVRVLPPHEVLAANNSAKRQSRRLLYLLPIRLLKRRMMVREIEKQSKLTFRHSDRRVGGVHFVWRIEREVGHEARPTI